MTTTSTTLQWWQTRVAFCSGAEKIK
jgi:hypothetical protein